MIDLKKIERSLDDALEKETPESLRAFLSEQDSEENSELLSQKVEKATEAVRSAISSLDKIGSGNYSSVNLGYLLGVMRSDLYSLQKLLEYEVCE